MREVIKGKKYTADEVNQEIAKGWTDIEDYRDLRRFAWSVDMTEEEARRLEEHGLINMLLDL